MGFQRFWVIEEIMTVRKYFGTDGIRGRANHFPMTAEMAMKVAMATALSFRKENGDRQQDRVVIGKDTRLSGYMLEQAMAAGFEAMGMDVIFVGPLPTPAVAMLTRSMRADLGVMISASHNPYEDNGIKLFNSDGRKLPDAIEERIEEFIDQDLSVHLPAPDRLGKASRLDDAQGRYIEFVKRSVARGVSLEGLKIVIDCAHGAAYKVAPQMFWELEADVITIGDQPNGRNINDGYGATAPQKLQEAVIAEKADIGIALDGDADRLIIVDEKGMTVDGDQIMALLATYLKEEGALCGDAIVATVMSNLGLEQYLRTKDIDLIRTPVGDRAVMAAMIEGGYNLGGEQSGHIILSDYNTSGDGLLSALLVLVALQKQNGPVSGALHLFEPVPQILKNVRFEKGKAKPLDDIQVQDAIKSAEKKLANDGRLLVRASGTESVIRVMAEGNDLVLVKSVISDLCNVIEQSVEE